MEDNTFKCPFCNKETSITNSKKTMARCFYCGNKFEINTGSSFKPKTKEKGLEKNPLKAVDLDNNKIVYDGCMLTKSNVLIDLYNPDPDLIFITDIAHGLANNCRWNGHTQKFWSVAQHCCMMYDKAPEGDKLKYLFHDAEEAYWGDMIKPLKNKIKERCPEIIELMTEMRKIIYDKFKIDYIDEEVEKADFECLQWEFENIIKSSNAEYWMPERAKAEWLDRYYKEMFKRESST